MRIPTSNSCVGVLVIFLCLFLFVGTAQCSGVTTTDYTITVTNTATVNNMTALYAEILSMSGGNTSLAETNLSQVSPKVWMCNKRLYVLNPGTNFYINDTDCSELRIDPYGGIALQRNITINNCTLTAWNRTTDTPETYISGVVFGTGIVSLQKNCSDVTFNNFRSVNFGSTSVPYSVPNLRLENITLKNTIDGLYIQNADGSIIHDITVVDGMVDTSDGMDECFFNNSTVYNVYVNNISSESETPGAYGFRIIGSNNTYHDININRTGCDCIALRGNYLTCYNMTSNNSGHAGWEYIGHDSTFDNITSIKSNTFGFDLQANSSNYSHRANYNLTFTNLKFYNQTHASMGVTEGAYNCTFDNISFYRCSNICSDVLDTTDITISNVSLYNCTGGGMGVGKTLNTILDYIDNIIYRDSDVTGTTATNLNFDFGTGVSTRDNIRTVRFINCKYNSARSLMDAYIEPAYYLDIAVKNGAGTLLDGTLNITNNVNASKTAYNILGAEGSIYSFINGRTPLPYNRSYSPVIRDLSVKDTTTPSSFIYYTYTANITTASGNVSLDAINPYSGWYRRIPSQSNYTITAIVNNSENTHLTGYAPSATQNNYVSGDTVKFQVWTSENVDSIEWKVDNTTVATNTTTYTTTVGTAPIQVDIYATDTNGNISNTWVIDPNQAVTPDPDPDPSPDPEPGKYEPVCNFTSNVTNGTVPLKVQFNDTSENATAWYWDFDNNGKVDSTVRNATFRYKTPGNYTAKLTVSNTDGVDSEIKTGYISTTKQPWYVVVWSWFGFGLTGGLIHG